MTIVSSDKRAALYQLLKQYRPENDADRAQQDAILAFVESTPNCFERSHAAGHITGSAWVVDRTGKKVLLTHHKKLNKWLQLGGHADGDSDLRAVALKEAREESGLRDLQPIGNGIFDLDVHPIPERKNEPAHFHYDIRFVFQANGSEQFTVSDESNELAWLDVEKMTSLSNEEAMLRMARKWLTSSAEERRPYRR